MNLGLLSASAAAAAYGSATVLQAQGVAAAVHGRRLVTHPRYVAGLALDLLGFGATAVALRSEPLFLVQAAVAASIGVTALLARSVLGTALRRREVAALLVLGGGLLLMAGSARSGPGEHVGSAVGLALLAGVPVLALVTRSGSRSAGATGDDGSGGVLLAVVAGLAGGTAGICARALDPPDHLLQLLLQPSALALAGYGVVCAWAFAQALRSTSVTVVTATCFAVSTVVPALVGLAVLGDRTRPGWGAAAAIGVLAVLGATAVLAGRAGLVPAPAPA